MNILDRIKDLDAMILNQIAIDLASGEFYKKVDEDLLELCLRSMKTRPDVWDERGVISCLLYTSPSPRDP